LWGLNFEKCNFIYNLVAETKWRPEVVIISKAILREFGLLHPDAIEALNRWYETAKAADWGNLADLRQVFNSVDYVGNDRFVFNIRGNRYRLIAMIFFDIRTIYVRFVGTHQAYDELDVSTI
jgi:mRNA interferase HigB